MLLVVRRHFIVLLHFCSECTEL